MGKPAHSPEAAPEDPDQRVAASPSNASAAFEARILKNLDCLAVLDSFGDARGAGAAEGLFYQDTRYLSQLTLTIGGRRPLLLSSNTIDDGITIRTDLANAEVIENGGVTLQKEKVHLARSQEIGTDVFFDTIEVTNYQTHPVEITIGVIFDADFLDMFEVRGAHRAHRGKLLPDQGDASSQIIGYQGLDAVIRQTHLTFEPRPDIASARQRGWRLRLAPQERRTLTTTIRFERDGKTSGISLKEAGHLYAGWRHSRREQTAQLMTSDRGFSDWLRRSRFDLEMLVTPTTRGLIAYAGTPWYSTAFGRDSLITALQCLWLDPALAEGTLRYLAATQAVEENPAADAEPGKILHETRQGEMALLGEVPFRQYYGSVDSTPLFVMLAAAYYRRTGDLDFIRELWPPIEKALQWIEHYGDADGDGLIEYGRRSSDGLVNQGWKDSDDAIFHADGSTPEQPIAVVEVQGYAYEAWIGAAEMAAALGFHDEAARFLKNAERLRKAFQENFWVEELKTFALALDSRKRPCRVRSSNAGHVLLSGLATPEQAAHVADTLMHPDSFSGWGIRTIASGEARFNPMSYHNGSIWPHDNAVIAMGFARYGLSDHLATLVSQMFEVSRFVGQNRLPELFCGFTRRAGMGPSAYPVACSPQAWAAASVFGLMGAMLGISFDAAQGRLRFNKPMLLPFLQQIRLDNLRMNDASVDLILRERDGQLTVGTMRQEGLVEVVIT